ncbi:hypothetical protein [Moorena producens]|nr:hypothetical protein [Moorena producens]
MSNVKQHHAIQRKSLCKLDKNISDEGIINWYGATGNGIGNRQEATVY